MDHVNNLADVFWHDTVAIAGLTVTGAGLRQVGLVTKLIIGFVYKAAFREVDLLFVSVAEVT